MKRPVLMPRAGLLFFSGLIGLIPGCAPPQAGLLSATRIEPAQYPKAAAVILKDRLGMQMEADDDSSQTTYHQQRVYQILRPAGLQLADVKLSLNAAEVVVGFEAQTVHPDGQVTPVLRSHVFVSESRKGGAVTGKTLRFTFPHTRVGSVLSYSVVTRVPFISDYWYRSLPKRYPVVASQVRIDGPPQIRIDVGVHHHASKPVRGTDDDRWWVEMNFRDIEPSNDEALRPHWSRYRPHWMFRMTHRIRYSTPRRVFADWPSAFRTLAHQIWVKWGTGTGPLPDVSTCADHQCRIQAAWDSVLPLPSTGFRGLKTTEPLARSQADGRMSAAQRAVLLWRRLTALGLEAWPAALARNHTHQIDWDRPMPSWLDHLIVLVPRQDGVDAPIWLDPECWWCAVGDLPHWSANAQVLVLDYDSKRRRLEAGRRTAMGSAPVRTLREEVFTGTLTGTGDFSGEWMQRHTGVAASALRRAGQNDPGVLKDRLGAGATVGPMAHACELSAGRCSRRQTFSVSGYATRMGDRWVIPLRAFHNPGWLDDLAPSKRKAPFRIFGPQREYRQRFEIQLPPGSALRSAPAPMTVENTMGRMTFRAWAKGSRLMVERTLALNPKTHPPEKWGALRPPFNLFRRLRDAAIIVGPKPSP